MSGVVAALSATQQIQNLLPKTTKIHQRLTDIATELDLNWRGANTFMAFDFDRVISFEELGRVAGFSAALWGDTSVKVFAPLTADDEYFDALRIGLQRLSTKPV
jgi:hypothetical protein